MPRITINEQEDPRLAAFDVTENTVLIPMLYVRSWDETAYTSEVPGAMLFTSAKEFRDTFNLGGGLNGSYHRYVTISNTGYPDKSATMAFELLLQGLNVVVKPIKIGEERSLVVEETGEVTISAEKYQELLHKAIVDDGAFDEFVDKNLYNIKFITSGAYPNIGSLSLEDGIGESMYTTMIEIAKERADAIAMVEFRKDVKNTDELFELLEPVSVSKNAKYAAAFFPWCNFNTTFMNYERSQAMPACFAYLMAYANSVQSNANWFAASGVSRGFIPNMLTPLFEVGESLMHALQGDTVYKNSNKSLGLRVNPIMNAGTYGYRIWGNRVMWPGESGDNRTAGMMYQEFLNVRVLLCDIKKQVYHTAMRTTFEPNDDIVWINFKSLANTLLDRMKSGRGIKWYKWVKEKNEEKATIEATLYIQPIEAVEYFKVNVYLTDEDISVEEAVVEEV